MWQKRNRLLAAAGMGLLCSATLLCRAAGTGVEKEAVQESISQQENVAWQEQVGEEIFEAAEAALKAVQEVQAGPEAEVEPKAQTGPEAQVEPEMQMEAGAQVEPEAQVESEVQAEPEVQMEPEAQVEPESETAAESGLTENAVQENNCIRKKIYHRHTGSTEQGGGCHGARREWTTSESKRCNSKLRPSGGSEKGRGVCDSCGGYSSRSSGTCGRVKESKTVHHVAYDRNCGCTESTELGEVTLSWDTEEWSRQVTLQGSYILSGSGCRVEAEPFVWNKEQFCTDGRLLAEQNGVYTLQLNLDENCNTEAAAISYTVKNVDHTAPIIEKIDWEKDQFVTETVVTITAEDIQPETECMDENKNGSGLHQEAYSFDGGNTWQTENHATLNNGIYQVAVRDRLGNTATQEITVNTVDDTGPAILEITKTPSGWTRKNVTVSVQAVDYQSDLPGLAEKEQGFGSGLHEKAWSFDGGRTFQEHGSYCAKENGKLELVVRDRLGNQTTQRIEIANIDRIKPHIDVTKEPVQWWEGPLTLKIKAHDEESGLPERPYSWDEGTTWTDKTQRSVTQEGYYKVLIKDRAGNQNYHELIVHKEVVPELPPETQEVLPEEEQMIPVKEVQEPVRHSDKEHEVEQPPKQVRLPEKKAAVLEPAKANRKPVQTLEQEIIKKPLPPFIKIVLFLLGVAVFLLMLLLLFWMLYSRVKVYVRGEREEFELVMHGWLNKRGTQYCFKMPKGKVRRKNYTHIKLVLTKWFAKSHEGEMLELILEGVETNVPVKREIHLS